MGKRFLRAVADVPFLADSYFVKSESAIYTKGRIPYAIMQAESKDSEDILWDPGFVEEHNIDKNTILESFLSLGRRKLDSIQWAK
jgi:hypothetical protein